MISVLKAPPCTSRWLDKLNSNLQWARMKVKPSKSRSLSIIKGKVIDKKFAINEEVKPTLLPFWSKRLRPFEIGMRGGSWLYVFSFDFGTKDYNI